MKPYIIIASRNEGKELIDTIHSIHQTNGKKQDHGIVVIDDGDGSDLSNVLAEKFTKSNVIPVKPSPEEYGDYDNLLDKEENKTKQRMGPNRARNYGAKLVMYDASFFVFCDGHLKFNTNNWLKKLQTNFDKNPKVGIITGNIDGGLGEFIDESEMEVKWNTTLISGKTNAPFAVSISPAGFLAIRKEVFKKILGFNPAYYSYGFDEEISIRTWLSGYDILCDPSISINHKFKTNFEFKVSQEDILFQKMVNIYVNFDNMSNIYWNFKVNTINTFGEPFFEKLFYRFSQAQESLSVYKRYFDEKLFSRTPTDFLTFNKGIQSENSYIPKKITLKRAKSAKTTQIIPMKFIDLRVKQVQEHALMVDIPKKGDSGMDLKACLPLGTETIVIEPNTRELVKTGISIELPQGHEAQVRSRSGLALKNGICVLNGIGTIDNSYRGEIGVILYNSSDEPFEIKHGDRIAQLVVAEYVEINKLTPIQQFVTSTDRDDKGFGSSGV
jgi:dUTP pyrophosphatase